MTTSTTNIKNFRQNIHFFSKELKEKHSTIIVTKWNKPIFEVKPCINDVISQDEVQTAYYKTLEKSLSFWNDKEDDNIFEE